MSTTVRSELIDAFCFFYFSVLFFTVPLHVFFWCWPLFWFSIFVDSGACVLQDFAQPTVCSSATTWSSSPCGARCGNLWVQLSGSISSLHVAGVAQGHLAVLGWVCTSPGMLELARYSDAPFWYPYPPSSCPSMCPTGLCLLQHLHGPSLPWQSTNDLS